MTVSSVDFRLACGHFATGIAVLTAATEQGVPFGMTVNSFVSLSLDPPLVMVAVDRKSGLMPLFEAAGSYAINILSEGQRDISTRFAKPADDRFRGVIWEVGISGAPILAGTIAHLECRVVQRIDAGDHRVYIGEAVDAHVSDGQPLLYFRSQYRELGE